jgi:hypothetical protein
MSCITKPRYYLFNDANNMQMRHLHLARPFTCTQVWLMILMTLEKRQHNSQVFLRTREPSPDLEDGLNQWPQSGCQAGNYEYQWLQPVGLNPCRRCKITHQFLGKKVLQWVGVKELKTESRALLEDTDEHVVETLGACPHKPSVWMHLNRKTLNKG